MKILFTVSSSSLMDGINRHVLEIASALANDSDVNVGVCVLHATGALNAALDASGVLNWSLGSKNGHDWRGALSFRRVLQHFKPDIVHIHVLGFFEQLVLKTMGGKIKVVNTIHGISRSITNPSMRDRVNRLLFRPVRLPVAGTIFISDGVREFFDKRKPIKGFHATIYNPIRFVAQVRNDDMVLHRELGIPSDVPIVGTACRIAEQKNPKAFVAVMLKVLRQCPEAHAVVIGSGVASIEKEIRLMVSQEDMDGRFHFLGYRTNAPELVREFSCFIMTSHWEGLPTSLLECIVQKVPFAFMTGYGGLQDIERINLEKGPFAVCVKQGAIELMATEVVRLLEDKNLAHANAERAYDVCRKVFDVKSIKEQLKGFYQAVLKEDVL